MISAEALAALSGIEHGARYNTVHSIARELMAAGYASDDWGNLGITEAGRCYLRRGQFKIAISGDEHVSDISVQRVVRRDVDDDIDPMSAPHRVNKPAAPLELVPEAPPEPLPIAQTRMQEMLRAAGVASGITGVWVEDRWVEEFIRALDGADDSVISERI
jgi:hypothetical protein